MRIRDSMKYKVIAGSTVLGVILIAVTVWLTARRIEELDSNLQQANERSARLQSNLSRTAASLAEKAAQERRAREEAAQAEKTAEQLAAERERARLRADQSEEEAERARAAAEQAKQRETQSRQQLAAMRDRRTAELNRMQEALSKIAPTRRTSTGMVIDLTDESFGFDFDQATLRPKNREMLSRIAGVLLASEGYRLFVYGHTDDVGSDEYNQRLSERRAESVGDYLAKAGVPTDVMEVKGFGKSNPRADNSSRSGREKNRRVEIGIVDSIIDYGDIVDLTKAQM